METAVKCLPNATSAATGTTTLCSTPFFGAKTEQKFPLRWFDIGSSSSSSMSSLTDSFAYWEMCYMTSMCPKDGPAAYTLRATFNIKSTIASFDDAAQASFKSKYAAYLNSKADAAGSITPANIKLEISAGSINVKATVTLTTYGLTQALVTVLNAATATDLSATLGVEVNSISAVEAREVSADGKEQELSGSAAGGGGGGDSGLSPGVLGAIIGGSVGGVLLIAGIIVGVVCCMKRKKTKQASKEPAVQMQIHDGGKV